MGKALGYEETISIARSPTTSIFSNKKEALSFFRRYYNLLEEGRISSLYRNRYTTNV